MSTSVDRAEAREMGVRVHLRGLEKRYGAKRALGPVDLELDRSEIVGVVGPDGAGKSTLLRSIAGLLEIVADDAVVGSVTTSGATSPSSSARSATCRRCSACIAIFR